MWLVLMLVLWLLLVRQLRVLWLLLPLLLSWLLLLLPLQLLLMLLRHPSVLHAGRVVLEQEGQSVMHRKYSQICGR